MIDVGGGPGVYAAWLVSLGYDVHLVDAVARHVEQGAEHGIFTTEQGGSRARALRYAGVSACCVSLSSARSGRPRKHDEYKALNAMTDTRPRRKLERTRAQEGPLSARAAPSEMGGKIASSERGRKVADSIHHQTRLVDWSRRIWR